MEEKRKITILAVLGMAVVVLLVVLAFTIPIISCIWVLLGFILMTVAFLIFGPGSNAFWWSWWFFVFYMVLSYAACVCFVWYSLKRMPERFW